MKRVVQKILMKSKYDKYEQGKFTPTNPKKYKGTLPIFARSSLEFRFMRWCDRNDLVVEWGSETVVIPYISPVDGKRHRYFTDGNILLKVGESIKKYIIEIKPERQTKPPVPSLKKKRSTVLYEQVQYAINSAKWKAASEWAKAHGYNFCILNENDLK